MIGFSDSFVDVYITHLSLLLEIEVLDLDSSKLHFNDTVW